MSTHTAAQHHASTDRSEPIESANFSGFPALLVGLCCLLPLNVLAAESEEQEKKRTDSSYQDQDLMIVTGEKTARSLLDTGSSVEVFDSRRIDSMPGAETVSDLMRMTATPSISVSVTICPPYAGWMVPGRAPEPERFSVGPVRAWGFLLMVAR